MKYRCSFITLLVCFSIVSCNKNDGDTENGLFFSGFYQIDSITASELVDLNGDGQLSDNLKNEISDYFNNDVFDLEIRPNYTNDHQHKLISFYLPEPYLSFDYPTHPNGYVEYARATFGLTYEYKEKLILNDNSEDKSFGNVIEFDLLENNQIKAIISKKYYDFGINEWRDLNLEIVYVKVE